MADTLQVIPNMGFYKLPTTENNFQGSGGYSPVSIANNQYGNPEMSEVQTMDTPVQGIDNTQLQQTQSQPINANTPSGSLLQPGWDKKLTAQHYSPNTNKSISDAVLPTPSIEPQIGSRQVQQPTQHDSQQPIKIQSDFVKPKYQPGVDPYEYIFNTELRKPELNPEMQNRLKQRGLIDAFGRVAINLGDSMTLGMGGSPVLRPEQDTGRYMDEYYKNLEDYDRRLSDWDYKNYLNRLNASLRLNADENDKAIAESRIKQAQQEALMSAEEKEKQRKFTAEENQKKIDAANKRAQKEKNPLEDQLLKARIAATNRSNQPDKDKEEEEDNINYDTPAGKVQTKIPYQERNRLIADAKKNSEFMRSNKNLFEIKTKADDGTPFAMTDYEYRKRTGVTDRDILQAYLEYNSKDIPVPQREMTGNNPNYIPTYTDKKDLPSSGIQFGNASASPSKKTMWPGAKK